AVFVGFRSWLKESVEDRNIRIYSDRNDKIVRPHCQTKGHTHTKQVTQKKGISGVKATGAVITGGISVLATGLSRKEKLTQAHCITWILHGTIRLRLEQEILFPTSSHRSCADIFLLSF
ncbi:MAG: hypothetical protein ABII26_08785, partial [Pseudomonadota bacterium]